MSLRIIAGAWRGRTLAAPAGRAVRPTSGRAREALFSMLASRIGSFEGLRVIDMFAGSGALGLEALSRGAAHAAFVERDPAALATLRANIRALGAEARAHVLAQPVETLGRPSSEVDIAFLDPPYGLGLVGVGLARLRAGGWLSPCAWIAVETGRSEVVPELAHATPRTFGKARLWLAQPTLADD
ncbi:MAG: 16S rRNA (guanine(966)-N(2))-methyltransferase RsmD [Sphingomonadaceae bacterium]|nr:16S rRNA (guanine(966)-N(2))-methyltransferase RsmD [Sphingomonadaceae bacterium]